MTKFNYQFQNSELITQAMTHKSFRFENKQSANDNERLEFLGDAVLDLSLSETLMRRFPNDSEGALSKKRASLVNEELLASLAREIGLDEELRLGRGEKQSGGLTKPRLLASALEACLGAMFLDGGFAPVHAEIERIFLSRIEQISNLPDFLHDFKTRLQERTQELHKTTPQYVVEEESGPDHDKEFLVSVKLNERTLANGKGKSKKSAEQDAAKKALENL